MLDSPSLVIVSSQSTEESLAPPRLPPLVLGHCFVLCVSFILKEMVLNDALGS